MQRFSHRPLCFSPSTLSKSMPLSCHCLVVHPPPGLDEHVSWWPTKDSGSVVCKAQKGRVAPMTRAAWSAGCPNDLSPNGYGANARLNFACTKVSGPPGKPSLGVIGDRYSDHPSCLLPSLLPTYLPPCLPYHPSFRLLTLWCGALHTQTDPSLPSADFGMDFLRVWHRESKFI